MTRPFLILTLCASLAACSSEKSTEVTPASAVTGMIKAQLAKRKVPKAQKAPQKAPAAAALTQETLAQISQPLIALTLPKRGAQIVMVRGGQNQNTDTYLGAKQSLSVSLTDGLISATRGFGDDLLSQSLSVPSATLFQGAFPKTYSRTQTYIDGANQLLPKTYTCTLEAQEPEVLTIAGVSYPTLKLREVCKNRLRAFANVYWVESRSRNLRQSHQSISQSIGHGIIQVLKAP